MTQKKYNIMKRDKQDEQQRHAQRNYVIKEVRNQLVTNFGYSYTEADIFIGRIWGLGERQIQKILKRSDESALGADDFAEFVVLLQRISNRKDKKQ
jgi:hypothetical protein